MKVIWDKNGGDNHISDTKNIDYDGLVGIRYRGNSSYLVQDKKPLSVKLLKPNGRKKEASILGMGEDSDWVLLAPYQDKSLIRDMLIFELMKESPNYVPAGKFCEVIINGIYQGVYVFMERVREGKHRIDIKSLVPNAEMGSAGFLLEIDRDFTGNGFYGENVVTDVYGNPKSEDIAKRNKTYYQHIFPENENLSKSQKKYIQTLILDMEKAVAGNDFKDIEKGYRAYIDTTSITDFYIAQELSKNIDGYRFSTPVYKYPDSIDTRLKFALWDFNISVTGSTEGWAYNYNFRDNRSNQVPYMFKRLLQDELFYSNLKNRWNELRNGRLSGDRIHETVDSLAGLLSEAAKRNYEVWPFDKYIWPNYYMASVWDEEIDYLRSWLNKRVGWIDSQWGTGSSNYVANGRFEAASSRGNINEVLLFEWMALNSVAVTGLDVHGNDYAVLLDDSSKIYQALTELTPGKYDFRAWVKTEKNPSAYLYLKYFKNRDGSDELVIPVNSVSEYSLVEITDIDVINPFIEIGFYTQSKTGENAKLLVDDVEFLKVEKQ